jgi:hypothetical protein
MRSLLARSYSHNFTIPLHHISCLSFTSPTFSSYRDLFFLFRPNLGHTFPSIFVPFCRLSFVYFYPQISPHCYFDQNGGLLALGGKSSSSLDDFIAQANGCFLGRILLDCLLREDPLYPVDQNHRHPSNPRQGPRKLSPRSRHLDTLPQLRLSRLCDRPPTRRRI